MYTNYPCAIRSAGGVHPTWYPHCFVKCYFPKKSSWNPWIKPQWLSVKSLRKVGPLIYSFQHNAVLWRLNHNKTARRSDVLPWHGANLRSFRSAPCSNTEIRPTRFCCLGTKNCRVFCSLLHIHIWTPHNTTIASILVLVSVGLADKL